MNKIKSIIAAWMFVALYFVGFFVIISFTGNEKAGANYSDWSTTSSTTSTTTCAAGKIPCNGSCCDPAECKDCINGSCQSVCNSNNCETCVGGGCVICNGDPNKGCCNGQCYDTASQECCGGQIYDKGNCKACINGVWQSTCSPEYCEECVNNQCVSCTGDPTKSCCGERCCHILKCESCMNGSCIVVDTLCPVANGNCLAGGACGAGNYHKEIQARNGYPMCIAGAACDKNYECLVIEAYEDSNCSIKYAIYCTDQHTGCNPSIET